MNRRIAPFPEYNQIIPRLYIKTVPQILPVLEKELDALQAHEGYFDDFRYAWTRRK